MCAACISAQLDSREPACIAGATSTSTFAFEFSRFRTAYIYISVLQCSRHASTLRVWCVQDALIMLVGAIMLACATGTTVNGWVIMYAIAQLVYGVGVGGRQLAYSLTLAMLTGHRCMLQAQRMQKYYLEAKQNMSGPAEAIWQHGESMLLLSWSVLSMLLLSCLSRSMSSCV